MPIDSTRILQFAQQFQKFYNHQFLPILDRAGLTMGEIHVLLFLVNNPSYDTARDVALLRGLSKSQVSQAVELLAAKDLLRRTPDRGDRRIVHLSITPLGMPLARECQAIQGQCAQQLLAGLTPEEQLQFRSFLKIVLDNGACLAKEAAQ